MSPQSNVCACAVCTGSECKCGCQDPAPWLLRFLIARFGAPERRAIRQPTD